MSTCSNADACGCLSGAVQGRCRTILNRAWCAEVLAVCAIPLSRIVCDVSTSTDSDRLFGAWSGAS